MKPLQSLFSLVTEAHETTGLRLAASPLAYWYVLSHIAFVPQILEQKRDCSQSKAIVTAA